MIKTEQVVARLTEEASKNKVADAVFHVWGVRERHARNGTVTLPALKNQMEEAGFKFDSKDYAEILKLLADLGLGKLEVNAKGNVKALKHVQTTLQSIGKAACQRGNLAAMRKRNRYTRVHMATPVERRKAPAAPVAEIAKENAQAAYTPVTAVGLVVSLGTRSISIPVPKDLSEQELMTLVQKFAGGKK